MNRFTMHNEPVHRVDNPRAVIIRKAIPINTDGFQYVYSFNGSLETQRPSLLQNQRRCDRVRTVPLSAL